MKQAVCALIIHPETGHILACTRRGTLDQWGLIGGKIDEGETPHQALYREVYEETGCMIGSVESQPYFQDIDEFGYLTKVYRAPATRNMIHKYGQGERLSVEEGIIVGFVSITDLLSGPFAKFNEKWIHDTIRAIAA